jgi:hypothetical protein
MESPGLANSKDYEIQVLDLINSGGQVVDVRKIFMEMQLFQDIYSSVMSGTIVIQDGHDIFSNFYFCGNEFIRISIDKPSLGKPIQKVFRIYKVGGRKPASDSGQIYSLFFCSEELIFSNQKRVSKAYKGLRTADIIRDILLNELHVDAIRIGALERTSGVYDLVVPGYRPLEVAQWAASRSYDASGKYCYFFYEDRDGFQFKSYNTMIKQKPLKDLKYEIKRVDQIDPALNKDSIDRVEIKHDFDILTMMSNGGFASKLLSVDIFNQSFKYDNYSIEVAEGQKNLINEFKPTNGLKNYDKIPITRAFDTYFLTNIAINDTASERGSDRDKWLMNRTLHMSAMNTFKLNILIPGDILLKAGDMVKYEFPKFVSPDPSGKDPDEYRTGKYLVAAVCHKFSGGDKGDFESIVELVSDSVSKQIPAAKDGLDKVTRKYT